MGDSPSPLSFIVWRDHLLVGGGGLKAAPAPIVQHVLDMRVEEGVVSPLLPFRLRFCAYRVELQGSGSWRAGRRPLEEGEFEHLTLIHIHTIVASSYLCVD